MKPVTIIVGGKRRNKTSKAIEMARGRRSYFLNNLSYSSIREIPDDIDLIVVDAINSNKDLAELKEIATQERMSFRPLYSHVKIDMERPEIIAISNIDIEESRRFNIIKL